MKSSRVEMNYGGDIIMLCDANQPRFSAPRPVSGCMDVNNVWTLVRRSAASNQFLSRTPVGPPFSPEAAWCMRSEELSLPTFRRKLCECAHDRSHAARGIARADMQHLAHNRVERLRGDESTGEFPLLRPSLVGGHKGECNHVRPWSWCRQR